jgi:hypothetical protein
MPELTISSWNELQDALFLDAWREDIRRFRSPYVFRGMSAATDTLRTSLIGQGGDFARLEPHLLRNFRKYAHRDIVEQDTFWHWLSLAQHHGLPTRLLDWTVSPFVAAHFATANTDQYDWDAAIWMVDAHKVQDRLPEKLRETLQGEGADYFTVDILARTFRTLAELDALAPPEFVIFFEPPSMDDRIVNQFALFSVMPGARTVLDAWLGDHPDLWHKIILPAGLKWEIRDRLDQANITERVLFPGLDGLSQWLKRYYTPRV